jgi:hypothetical protein
MIFTLATIKKKYSYYSDEPYSLLCLGNVSHQIFSPTTSSPSQQVIPQTTARPESK